MIRLLTELLTFYPTHSQVLDLWVQEVVPAVDDVEDSVVEEALRVSFIMTKPRHKLVFHRS